MSAPTVFQQALGPGFAELAPALQRLHAQSGWHELRGEVDIEPPASMLGLALAWCLGTPRHAASGALRFELEATPAFETWTRHFPGRVMRSRLACVDGRIEERLGVARLQFELDVDAGALTLRLVRMRLLGIACPARLRPRLTAVETGEGGRLRFHIEARVPGIGRVVGYRGWLAVPKAAPA